jgi:hypothetical protein
MILNELFISENRFKGYGQDDFEEILRRAGYMPIDGGAGFFSRVHWKNGDPHALKIFFDWDHSYKKFVDFAMRNQGNPHMPKFKNGKIARLNYNHVAIRVELLEPWEHSEDPLLVRSLHILTDADIGKQLMFSRIDSDGNELASISHQRIEMEHASALEHISTHYPPSLLQIIEKMNKELYTDGYTSDFKSDNLMLRGNTLVLIDPVRAHG